MAAADATSRFRVLTLLVLAAGCQGTEWSALPHDWPTRWRGRSLHSAPEVLVVAGDAAEAEDARELVGEMRELWRQEGGADAGRGLVVAMEPDSELPVPDPAAWMQKVMNWHRAALGVTERVPAGGTMRVPEDIPIDLGKLARIVTGAVPASSQELELPAAWVAATRWVLIVPTRACIADAVDEMIDQGVAAKASFLQRVLLAPMMPVLKGKARGELEAEARLRILETLCQAAGGEPERLRACAERAGLSADKLVRR